MLTVLLSLACSRPDPHREPADSGHPWLDVLLTPSRIPDTLPLDAPPIDEALASVCPDLAPTVQDAGLVLRRVTLDASSARCNDGTPPVLYVRTALDAAHSDDWVIHLDGGASCDSYDSCVARWCAEENYDAADMSSAWSPLSISAGGILGLDLRNSFLGWNIAQLYYCSSDDWLGTRPNVQMAPSAASVDTMPPFSVRFEGDGIFREVMEALSVGLVSDDGTQSLPSLDTAQTILFGGSSAGGYGAGLKLSQLAREHPQARVLGVVDSALTPSRSALSLQDAKSLDLALQQDWLARVEGAWGGALDEVCIDSTPSEDRWRCFDMDHLLQTYIDVPVAVHYDLYDPVPTPFFIAAGIDESDYASSFSDTLRQYSHIPGLYAHGSACAIHMSLTKTSSFLEMSVTDTLKGGPPVTMHGVLRSMVDGVPLSAVDDSAALGSSCPP